jgi:hypothetical protein
MTLRKSGDWTWIWTASAEASEMNRLLEAAAKKAWPCAILCACSYLHDRDCASNRNGLETWDSDTVPVARWPNTTPSLASIPAFFNQTVISH